MYTLRECAKALNIDLKGARVAVQGFGNAGQHAHRLLEQMFGAVVIAVSDSSGGIFDPNGLSYDKVKAHKDATGKVTGFAGSKEISNEAILALDVDILVPAALENVLRADNAGQVTAKVVAELANGPTTPEADEILYQKGIYVIPDFLCNAGGVTVSWMEQVQNAGLDKWTLDRVHKQLDDIMSLAFATVHAKRESAGVHTRLAAYLVAVQRVADACKLRGWV